VGELALFRIPFHLELRYSKQLQTGIALTDAMAEGRRGPASVMVTFLYHACYEV
jgi:DUF917 family protein